MNMLLLFIQLLLLFLFPLPAIAEEADYTPICPTTSFSGYASGPGCGSYFICTAGVVVSPVTNCHAGTLFNEILSVCDFAYNFECGSTKPPSRRPTKRPTVSPTTRLVPTTPNPTLPPQTRSPSANVGVEDALFYAKRDIDTKIFVYQSGWSDWLPSTQYRFDGFLRGLQIMYLEGVGDLKFYLGEDVRGDEGVVVGLVNIAAFLAQSMKETIKYNACDENNWDIIDGTYPLSNACGQLEQSYQDYVCPAGSEHMQCEVDPRMEQRATTNANWYGAPGPLYCGPQSKYPHVGYWDYSFMCDYPWKDPPELCPDYPGQKGGKAVNDEPVENRNGRTDVEGCCWWGRGVIQTTGVCNFGMLNYYLGKRAADEGRDSRYPHIDFCKDPDAICNREEHSELKWIAGMFYWIRSLQTYDEGWNYFDNLKSFVRGGMKDGAFIDAVSGIVNRGCHNPPCGTGPLDGASERKENFEKVLEVLIEPDGSPRKFRPMDEPTYFPTYSTYPPTVPKKNDAVIIVPPYLKENEDSTKDTSPPNYGPGEEWIEDDEEHTNWSEEADDHYQHAESEEEEDWSAVVANYEEDWSEADEDWSGADDAGSSSTMNLWCGQNQPEAYENCGRNGYDCLDGLCVNGLKCFMTDDCDNDKEETLLPTARPTPRPTVPASTPRPTLQPTPNPTPKPTSKPTQEEILVNNIGLRNNYCARSMALLPTACVTAKTCTIAEDCPSGTYCWGEHMCGGAPDTPPPILGQNNAISPPTPMPTKLPVVDGTSQSEATTASMTESSYFCGTSRSQASLSCHKRCRSASREECDEGEACFGYTTCKAETPRAPEATNDPTKNPTNQPTKEPTNRPTNEPTKMSKPPTQNPTKMAKPTTQKPSSRPTPTDSVAEARPAVPQLFCASGMAELEASCGTAQSCNSGPCPSGAFCFPFECATAAVIVGEQPLAPAATVSEPPAAPTLEPTKLPGNQQPASGSGPENLPSTENGQQSSPKENKPAPSSAENNQQTESSNNQRYSDLCPQEQFVGYHASEDCKEYWHCDSGMPDVRYVCEGSLKFDKVRENCQPADIINDYCYGPSLVENVQQTESSNNQRYSDLCPQPQFVGYQASKDCKEYWHCDSGMPDVRHICEGSRKFDKVRENCQPADVINDYCYGPDIQTSQSLGLCKDGYTGWEARLGCKEYFFCNNGEADVLYNCGEDLLFDRTLELCNFAHLVHCVDKGGPATPRPVPTYAPTTSRSPAVVSGWGSTGNNGATGGNNSGSNGGVVGDYNWPDDVTPNPTVSEGQSEIPPWLMGAVMTPHNSSVSKRGCGLQLWLWLLVVYIPLQFTFLF